ncbi:MAG: hypothetical protein IBX52_08745 [Bacterioplanes sp.]|nr:hypothetical protein [Bacterioplanes sp.]
MWPELSQYAEMPVIGIPDWTTIRQQLPPTGTSGLSLAEWALICGARADSLSLAFLWGYQVAMRRVDAAMSSQNLSAWCVSESGLSSLRAMVTEFDPVAKTVTGRKSHVMLMAQQQLDWLYVLTRVRDTESLVAVKISAAAEGIVVIPSQKTQPFVAQVPHAAVTFTNTPIASDFYVDNAHAVLNRPFRFWEDCYVSLAFVGWFWRRLPVNSRLVLEQSVAPWLSYLATADQEYDARHLRHSSALFEELDVLASNLPADAATQWQQDKMLLILGERARAALRVRFSKSAER